MSRDRIILPDEGLIEDLSSQPAAAPKAWEGFVVDGHVDLTYLLQGLAEPCSWSSLDTGPFTPVLAREAGVRLFGNALYLPDQFNGPGSLKRFLRLYDFASAHLEGTLFVRTAADLMHLREDEGTLGVFFLLENADALADDPRQAESFREKGILFAGLTHQGPNRLAQGNAVAFPGGISSLGREVIHVLGQNGVVLDTAHLHPSCFWQTCRITDAPLVNSHTGLRKFHDTPRNLDLEQAGEIISRDGVIGITCNPEMLVPEGPANLSHVYAHLDTLVQRFGPRNVAVGSDFCGFEGKTKGMEDVRGLPALGRLLLEHGYGEEAVEGILGRNWLRFVEALLGPGGRETP